MCVAGSLLFPLIDQMIMFTRTERERKKMQRMKYGNLKWVNKGISYSHASLNSEEYDVKNDDNKRELEKGSFSSSLLSLRIYLFQERQEE